MSFLDENGLAYFYGKLKEKFIRSVTAGNDVLTPDTSGNINIVNVPTANNLTSPDAQTSYGTFVYRTSGGEASLTSGDAQLTYVDGNMEIIGRVYEDFDITTTNQLIVSYNAEQWRNTINTSGTYYFRYTRPTSSTPTQSWQANGVWTSDGVGIVILSTYGLNVSTIINPSISASVNSSIIEPSISASVEGSGITNATVVLSTFASQMQTSGLYSFVYSATSNSWQYMSQNVLLSTYGISVTGTPNDEDTIMINFVAGSGLSEVTVIPSTFANEINTDGAYQFIYSATSNSWQYMSQNVSLSTYGISVTGIPNDGDTVTINFIAGTPDSVVTVVYTAAERGTIYVPQPTGFSATGFNQFDKDTMVIENATFTGGTIASGVNTVAYCRAKGGVDNGYVAYSEGEYIVGIGWCAALPEIGSTIVTTSAVVSASLASIPFDEDGYVVVEVTDANDLCVHPKWSGAADTDYAEYVEPSVIIFPLEDTSEVDLPLKTYGMPRVGAVPDTLDLDAKIYIQRIGRLANTSANMDIVISYGTDYEYDDDYIYYVLPQFITYNVNVSPDYIVNDWGTEEFLGTNIPCTTQILYSQNLRDKLRTDVLTISQQSGLTDIQLQSIAHNIGLALYPIGSIYMSANSTSPAALFGGTWEQIKDKFLLSAGDTYTAGTTGGSATNSHTHSVNAFTSGGTAINANQMPSHAHNMFQGVSGTISSTKVLLAKPAITTDTSAPQIHSYAGYVGDCGTSYTGQRSWGKITTNTGGNQAHTHSVPAHTSNTPSDTNNMPPYLTIYAWQRVA